jgi:dTMP kinase
MSLPRRLCRGLLIVFEGVDGAGKTTQVRLLDQHLRRAGYDVVCLKEPTEGPWGQKLRHLAQHGRQHVSPATELEWFLQDRRENVEQNIRPALARGQIVLLDRYYFSTIAYQGALQLDPEEIRVRNEAFAPPPDLLFILDLPPERGLQRVRQRGELSHFERLDYLERVAAIFAAMQFPYLRHIDASLEPTLVQERVCQAVAPLLAGTAATGCHSDSPPTRCRGDSAPEPATAQEEGRLKTPSADAVAEDTA